MPNLFFATAASAAIAGGTPSDIVKETDAWHAGRIERLTAPDGWLSLVGLSWLETGANAVGSADDAKVKYEGFAAGNLGAITLSEDWAETHTAEFDPAPGVDLPAGTIRTDGHPDGPTVLQHGTVRFHVIERAERPAVRIRDEHAETLTGFAGIDRFEASASWRITADFTPNEKTITVESVIGLDMESDVAGYARFTHNGTEINAALFKAGNSGATYLRFGDATNGSSTYTIGRYLYVEPPKDGKVVLDFNRSYNAPCALTAFATCTLPPASNVFPFPVEAGEKSPKE